MSLLTYAPNATKVGFADISTYNNTNFSDKIFTPEEQKDLLFTEANKCRGNYKPTWSNETQYLPSKTLPQGCKKTISAPNAQNLTIPPNLKDNTIINLALAGIGIIILIKILQ